MSGVALIGKMAKEAWGVGGGRVAEDEGVDERFEFHRGMVGRWLVRGWVCGVQRTNMLKRHIWEVDMRGSSREGESVSISKVGGLPEHCL